MAKDLSELIVVDVEATCLADTDPRRKNWKSEIIEIGVAVIDLPNKLISNHYSIYCIPEESEVTPFCTELTGIRPEQVTAAAGAKAFSHACALIQNRHKSRRKAWASWGDYDRTMFENQCHKSDYPFSKTHLNLKNLFALRKGLPKELGVPQALEHINKTFKGRLHSGKDDAFNIARLALYVL